MSNDYSTRSQQAEYRSEPGPEAKQAQHGNRHPLDTKDNPEVQLMRHRVVSLCEEKPETASAEAKHFVNIFLDGRLDSRAANEFIADTWGLERLTQEQKTLLGQLNDTPKLDDRQMEDYIKLLWQAKEGAVATLAYADIQVPERAFQIEHALNRACLEAIRDRSMDYPPDVLRSEHPDTARSYREAADLRLSGMNASPHNWDTYERALYLTGKQAHEYNLRGEPPEWFDPDTMTVTPEMRAQGYNVVNNGTLDPDGPAHQLALALGHRMRLLMQQDDHEPGISKLDFTRMALRPMLDQQLIPNLEHFDPAHAQYNSDSDAPLNDHLRLPYPGDTSQITTHTQASYGRNLQEAMAHTGLGESWNSDMLTHQIKHNLPGLQAMSQWASDISERNLHEPVSGVMDPPINWTEPQATNWQALADMTHNGTDASTLLALTERYQTRALEALTAHPTLESYTDRVQYQNLQDIRYPEQPDTRHDHVHSTLLREAMRDLDDARHCLEAAQDRVTTIHDLQASASEDPANLSTWFDRFIKNQAALSETDHLAAPATQALEEMQPDTAARLMADTGSVAAVAYYAQAIRHIAHADFVISNVSKDLNQPEG